MELTENPLYESLGRYISHAVQERTPLHKLESDKLTMGVLQALEEMGISDLEHGHPYNGIKPDLYCFEIDPRKLSDSSKELFENGSLDLVNDLIRDNASILDVTVALAQKR